MVTTSQEYSFCLNLHWVWQRIAYTTLFPSVVITLWNSIRTFSGFVFSTHFFPHRALPSLYNMDMSISEPPFQYSSGILVANNRDYCQKKTELQKHSVMRNILPAKLTCKGVQILEGLLLIEMYKQRLKRKWPQDYHVYSYCVCCGYGEKSRYLTWVLESQRLCHVFKYQHHRSQ